MNTDLRTAVILFISSTLCAHIFYAGSSFCITLLLNSNAIKGISFFRAQNLYFGFNTTMTIWTLLRATF